MSCEIENDEIIKIINRRTSKKGDCVEWTGYMDPKDIPRVYLKKRAFFVHRYIWEKYNPKILVTEYLQHSCGNKRCVNIDHLRCIPKKKPIIWTEVWNKLMKNSKREENGCLLWTSTCTNGYGFSSLKGRVIAAHRLSWMVKNEKKTIPAEINGEKTNIRHLCHNPLCIEPSHLKLGTLSENNLEDKIDNGTIIRGEKHHSVSISKELASEIKLSKRKRGDDDYVNQRSRSQRFGVSLDLVKSIDCGKSWAHLPDRNGNTGSSRAEKARILRANAKKRVWTPDEFKGAATKLYKNIVKTSHNKKGEIEGDCWEFQGNLRHGYGRITLFGKSMPTHVLSCEIKNGRHSVQGEVCRHLCGNKVCINPGHVEFGTSSENAIDNVIHGSKSCKLDSEKVRQIRDDKSSTQEELSNEYGVSVGTISGVQNNHTWKHVS